MKHVLSVPTSFAWENNLCFVSRSQRIQWVFVGAMFVACFAMSVHAQTGPVRPPNIVFILADDLGYGDLGCYGQTKIRTPHLDRMAREGMRLTQHYSGNAVCAPSRCVLMTGLHPGHAQVRNNVSYKPEGQEPLLPNTPTLARILQSHGYATGGFGKWGLGASRSTGDPLKQGIDRWYGYICQGVAHNFYPTHLWDNDRQIELCNPAFSAHDQFVKMKIQRNRKATGGSKANITRPI